MVIAASSTLAACGGSPASSSTTSVPTARSSSSRGAPVPFAVRVDDNRLLDGAGAPLTLRGVDRSGTEYACTQGARVFDGPSDAASVTAMTTWNVNAVRVPLNEDCWLGINGEPKQGLTAAAYRQAIASYVTLLHAHGLYAIVDLHWAAPGAAPSASQGNLPDDTHSPAFWASVAATFKSDPATVFDLFNEPNDDGQRCGPTSPSSCATAARVDWWCWKNGTCTTNDDSARFGAGWRIAGMDDLIAAVRSTGATNVVMAAGLDFANDMSQWLKYEPHDPAGQLAASFHAYDGTACAATPCWDATVLPVSRRVPVVTGEVGEKDGTHRFIDAYTGWADSHGIGYLAWTWDAWGCRGASVLVSDYAGTPCQTFGTGYRAHLAGLVAPRSSPTVPAPPSASAGAPMQLLNRRDDVTVYPPSAAAASDDDYGTSWRPGATGTLSFDVSAVPIANRSMVLLAWSTNIDDGYSAAAFMNGECPNYQRPMPSNYSVDVNSAPGGTLPDAGWITATRVTDNVFFSRQHLVDMIGRGQGGPYNWIRLDITASVGGVDVNVDLADAGHGVTSDFLFLGDSITALYAGHSPVSGSSTQIGPGIADLVAAGVGGTHIVTVNAGAACTGSADWDSVDATFSPRPTIDDQLAAFPGRYVTLSLGTNDAWAGQGDPDAFSATMASLIEKVIAAGKTPIVPHIPWPNNGSGTAWDLGVRSFNAKIDELLADHPAAMIGPDLYAVMEGHTTWFQGTGNVHPNERGVLAMRCAWAYAIDAGVYGTTPAPVSSCSGFASPIG